MPLTAIATTLYRGGTSKGPVFLANDLPADPALRDAVLLAVMGSPDARQIDGVGGADSLTSKVAVVGPSTHPKADVDYLFLQVAVNEARVDVSQNCGNMLAAVGPFAIEQGLVPITGPLTHVRIHMVNTGSVAVAAVETPEGCVRYDGSARIDGVPGTAAPIPIDFLDIAGSSCGALFPTGQVRDRIAGIEVTLIDNGMPVVIMRARDFGRSGHERPDELEADRDLKSRIEQVRLVAGHLMNLGDVSGKTVPKMCLVARPSAGGAISTRNFIPHTVHKAIGVFGAVSVATACVVPGTIAAEFVVDGQGEPHRRLDIEHPTGRFTIDMNVTPDGHVERAALLRTARPLLRGQVLIPAAVWDGRTASIPAAGPAIVRTLVE
jgi:4-oxalomesaconate tautomerase